MKKDLKSLTLKTILNVNNRNDLENLIGCRLSDLHLNNVNPKLYLWLFKNFFTRIFPERFWNRKFFHTLSLNEMKRKFYVGITNFCGEDCADDDLLHYRYTTSTKTVQEYFDNLYYRRYQKKSILMLKDYLIRPVLYRFAEYRDTYVSKMANYPVYKKVEYEDQVIGVPSIIVEIDNHSIDTSTAEGREQLEQWKEQVYNDLAELKIPGICEYTSARSYYLSYVFDAPLEYDEANDLFKGIGFYIFNERGYRIDLQNKLTNMKRIPLTKHQSVFFKTIVTPTRWTDFYYQSMWFIQFIKQYISTNYKKYEEYCKDNHVSTQFDYWDDLNRDITKFSVSRKQFEYSSKDSAKNNIYRFNNVNNSYKKLRITNFMKMLDNPLNYEYVKEHCKGLSYIVDNNIFALRDLLEIKDHSKNADGLLDVSAINVIRTFIKEYGNKLGILLGINAEDNNTLISSPLYDDKHPSCIYNTDGMKGYLYHFSDYPCGDIIDFIEYALLVNASSNNCKNDIKKEAARSLSRTVNFIAALMNVHLKGDCINKQNNIVNTNIYKEQYISLVDKAEKLMSFKNSFKTIALAIFDEVHLNFLKMKNINNNLYEAQCLLTNEYLAKKTGISKATISRYIAFMTATGIITREVEHFTNKQFLAKKDKKHQLATVLRFTDYSKVNVDTNFEVISKNKTAAFSSWNAMTYYNLFGLDGVIRAFGFDKAKQFKKYEPVNETTQAFIDILDELNTPYNLDFQITKPIFDSSDIKNSCSNMEEQSNKGNDNIVGDKLIDTDILESSNKEVIDSLNQAIDNYLVCKSSNSADHSNADMLLSASYIEEKSDILLTNKQLSNEQNNKEYSEDYALLDSLKSKVNRQIQQLSQHSLINEGSCSIYNERSISDKQTISTKLVEELTDQELQVNKQLLEEIIADESEDRKIEFRKSRPLKILFRLSLEELTHWEYILRIKAKSMFSLKANLFEASRLNDLSNIDNDLLDLEKQTLEYLDS